MLDRVCYDNNEGCSVMNKVLRMRMKDIRMFEFVFEVSLWVCRRSCSTLLLKWYVKESGIEQRILGSSLAKGRGRSTAVSGFIVI